MGVVFALNRSVFVHPKTSDISTHTAARKKEQRITGLCSVPLVFIYICLRIGAQYRTFSADHNVKRKYRQMC